MAQVGGQCPGAAGWVRRPAQHSVARGQHITAFLSRIIDLVRCPNWPHHPQILLCQQQQQADTSMSASKAARALIRACARGAFADVRSGQPDACTGNVQYYDIHAFEDHGDRCGCSHRPDEDLRHLKSISPRAWGEERAQPSPQRDFTNWSLDLRAEVPVTPERQCSQVDHKVIEIVLRSRRGGVAKFVRLRKLHDASSR
jgi:hypothetical protein